MSEKNPSKRPPLRATYRLQLVPGFGFDEAAAIVPYLADLGVSHLYLSPILEAAAGSTHGYDVIDHLSLRDAFGGRPAFERLAAAAHAAGLGIVVDIVPNHMSIADPRNQWWWDVLENGRAARAARIFDVDWDPPEHKLKDVVLVPVLGDHRGRVLARGEVTLARDGPRLFLGYFDKRYPIAPRSIGYLLEEAYRHAPGDRLGFFSDAYTELPLPTQADPASIERRHRDRIVLSELLGEHLERDPKAAAAIDRAIQAINADPDALDAFLDRQNYRLAYWRTAYQDLDYRRFFDLSTLVGLRVEDPQVFRATHALIVELLEQGLIDGLRVDHIDGLSDPTGYLTALRRVAGEAPIFVEKILASDEALRRWPVQGTTGYDFMNELTRVFVDPRGEGPLTELVGSFTGETRRFEEIAAEARLQVLREGLATDVKRLSTLALTIAERHRDARDLSRHDLHDALRAILTAFPRYRSYVDPTRDEVDDSDRTSIETAIARARSASPDIDPTAFDFLGDLLLLRRRSPGDDELVRRFQQLTPSAVAKGVEDTAFYRDVRLIALDEVGGDPSQFSMSLEAFHERNRRVLDTWPETLLATSTHDTKRSEDVRARLVLLAEDHFAFGRLAEVFFAAAERCRTGGFPEPTMILMALQSLIGSWPIDPTRWKAFLEKAAREAKLATSWTRVNPTYERALVRFADQILVDEEARSAVAAYVARIEAPARAISLAWTLLKLVCPGVPDFYQGSEGWHFALVDPDNRRPVDWQAAPRPGTELPTLAQDTIGKTKAHVIRVGLAHRREHPARFERGSSYLLLEAQGSGKRHVIAVGRGGPDGGMTVAVTTRWPLSVGPLLEDTNLVLPPGRFRELLVPSAAVYEGKARLAALLRRLPVALLTSERPA